MGFGIGVLVTLVPLYQSEVSPPESRGLMVGLHGVLIGFSYAMTGFVTYGESTDTCVRSTIGSIDVPIRLLFRTIRSISMAVPVSCPTNPNDHPLDRINMATVLASMAPLTGSI